MTTHLLVTQLRFTRTELLRCVEGVSDEEARKRFDPMNCIAWMVGHLANQENRYWNLRAQGKELFPELNDLVGSGKPASKPSLKEMLSVWSQITKAADIYLDTLTPELLVTYLLPSPKPTVENIGTLLLRNIYHYWMHIGEASAVRKLLGHKDLPQFVGDMAQYPYFREEKSI